MPTFRDPFGLRAAWQPASEPIDPVGRRAQWLHSGIRASWLLPGLAVALLADAPASQALDIGEGPVLMLAREVRLERSPEVLDHEASLALLMPDEGAVVVGNAVLGVVFDRPGRGLLRRRERS